MKTKNFFAALLICLIIGAIMMACGCDENNTYSATAWITKSQKPIVVYGYSKNMEGNRSYTLISAGGEMYNTGYCSLRLPDTIK